ANGVAVDARRREIGADAVPAADALLANLTADLMAPLADAVAASPPSRAILSGLRPHEVPGAPAARAPPGLAPPVTIPEPERARGEPERQPVRGRRRRRGGALGRPGGGRARRAPRAGRTARVPGRGQAHRPHPGLPEGPERMRQHVLLLHHPHDEGPGREPGPR